MFNTDKEMNEKVLDFSDCEYLGEVHKIIQEKLALPQWYGNNLDALWDALTGIMYVPVSIKIIYKPKNKKSSEFDNEIKKIIDVFQEAVSEYNEFSLAVDI
jgi:ribonuclease inhibitor